MKPPLWPHQLRTCDDLRKEVPLAARRRVCAALPCGAGKTSIIAELAERAVARGSGVVIVAHRRKLVQQIAERLLQFGVPYSVFMADLPGNGSPWAVVDDKAPVIVMSRDSGLAAAPADLPHRPKLAIYDECHTFAAEGNQRLNGQIEPDILLGLTATPCLSNGSGLGHYFDRLYIGATIEDLIAGEFLVPTEVFAPVGEGRKRRKGLPTGIAGDPVAMWFKYAEGLRTFAFTNRIREAEAVCQMYKAAGVPAVSADASTPDDVREAMLRDLAAGTIKVLCCTSALMGVGVDIAQLDCVQPLVKNGPPTAFWQTVGRGQRSSPGKKRAVLLDHAGAVYEHGMPNVSPTWGISPDDSVQMRTKRKQEGDPAAMPIVCKSCGCVFLGGGWCPHCGGTMPPPAPGKSPATVPEALQPFDGSGPPTAMQRQWVKILYQFGAGGMTCAAASCRFNSVAGVWPDAAGVEPRVRAVDRHRKVADAFPMFAGKRK